MAFAIPSKNGVRDREREKERKEKLSAANRGERRRERRGRRRRLEQDDRDIALCFLSGQMIYRVSPCTSPRATAPQKHVRGCKSHQKRRRQRRGFSTGRGARRRENRERGNRAARYGRYYIFMGFWSRHGSKFQANLGRK